MLLALAACSSMTGLVHAETAGSERFGEYLLLDDSSEQELVISNNALPESDVDGMESIQAPWKPTRWQAGRIPYQAEVQAAAHASQVDPALIHAVIACESGYNPRAQSSKGAYGLMQVLPATAKTMTSLPVRQWSAAQQIAWGTHYLKRMLDMFEGNVALALAAYNAGPQAVKAHQQTIPPFTETRQYVPRVLGYYQTFKTRLAQSQPQ